MPTTEGISVLVVEDEFLVAMDLEQTFLGACWNVIGPVPDVAGALEALGEQRPDVACLDMNLNGELSVPVAEELKRLDIPFVILTGYSARKVTDHVYDGAPIIHKPFLSEELVLAVRGVLR